MNWVCTGILATIVITVGPGMALPSAAIDIQPTHTQILESLARGKEAAQQQRRPDMFHVIFGAVDALHPGGFLLTKLGSLSVMAAHLALRGAEPSQSDIDHVINAPTMLVSTVILGETPSFAVDSYMVLEQGARTIKPATVRVDGLADRSAAWPNSPRFKAKVVASFNYADFDPTAKTSIIVFPAQGGTVTFPLDFSQIQ